MHAHDKANICGRFREHQLAIVLRMLRGMGFEVRSPLLAHEGQVAGVVLHNSRFQANAAALVEGLILSAIHANTYHQLHVVLYPAATGRGGFDVAAHCEADEFRNVAGHAQMVIEGLLFNKTANYVLGTKRFDALVRGKCGFMLLPRGRELLRQGKRQSTGPSHPLGIDAKVAQRFDVSWNRKPSKLHTGIDIEAKAGAPVSAVFSGRVEDRFVFSNPSWGTALLVRNNAGSLVPYTCYLHLEPASALRMKAEVTHGITTVGKIHRDHLHLGFCKSPAEFWKRGALVPSGSAPDPQYPRDPPFPWSFVNPAQVFPEYG